MIWERKSPASDRRQLMLGRIIKIGTVLHKNIDADIMGVHGRGGGALVLRRAADAVGGPEQVGEVLQAQLLLANTRAPRP